MQPAHLYDSAITVYSPDGRIYQVEYAREVVRRGTTVVGVTGTDGVGFLAERRGQSKLAISESVEKLFKIDDHLACASCGLVADARALVATARVLAQRHRMTYEEPMEVQALARELSDRLHAYTQQGGARPFGVSLLIGGLNERARLYETDPSGAFVGYKASALGARRGPVMTALEQTFLPSESLQVGLKKAHAGLVSGVEAGEDLQVEGAIVTKEGYRRLTHAEVLALAAAR